MSILQNLDSGPRISNAKKFLKIHTVYDLPDISLVGSQELKTDLKTQIQNEWLNCIVGKSHR